jgi:hypothetical protein
MTDQQILDTYKRNRHLANTRGWPAVGLGFLGFGLGILSLASATLSTLGLVVLFGGTLVMIAGLRAVSRYTRCPACNVALRGNRGLLLDAATCPSCGVRLQ